MTQFFLGLALALVLFAAGGFVVHIVTQRKVIYRWSYRILFSGFAVLTLYLGLRYYDLGAAPVLTLKSSLVFFAWAVIGACLLFQLRFKLMVLSSFATPLAACLLIVSSALPGGEAIVKPMYKSLWLTIHVGTIFMGNGIFALTFLAAIMYLIQERQIKKKQFGGFFNRLPSLATLDAVNHYTLIYGFPLLTVGMVTGAIYAQYALGSYWRWDPKEIWSLITWLFYATLLHERLAVGWRGRRAAILSIAAFMVLIFTFVGASLWLSDYHSFKTLRGGMTP
ncbi:MAG: c-type cytochrome biogenesis protein CcsB [Deltaproteobacteria bacterium]|nr:c-type cytochrome biogenesis protein CcsB [Deltaproteobacteria bacterium]MBW2015386.1 c-type cytochrome biogenesis protein CcsB [Deltaproteobacteria bacterium]MBW2128014.1 c-type cytochrome biogenesis protein CcsB [Deltaproteobacteria bacterium]MBW2302593.1 c-type cytochrome biogenesis protein CcsB [Deltaproteobacteria bacterium]